MHDDVEQFANEATDFADPLKKCESPGRAGELTSVCVAPPGLFAPVLFMMLTLGVPLIIVGVIGSNTIVSWAPVLQRLHPIVKGICLGLPLALILPFYSRIVDKRLFDQVKKLYVVSSPSLVNLVKHVHGRNFWWYATPPTIMLGQVLAKNNRNGTTIVAWYKQVVENIVPFAHAFEPRVLNEVDEAFDDFGNPGVEPARTVFPRGLRRMLKVRFFWFFLVFDILSAIGYGVVSYHQRRVHPLFLFWSALFLFVFFSPQGAMSLRRGQWLVVPGGLLHRRSRMRDKGIRLHVFDRRTSVLFATEMRNRMFLVAIADVERIEKTMITKTELDVLLRAWLSPLPPPKLDQVSDFR